MMIWGKLLNTTRVRELYGEAKSDRVDDDPRTEFQRDYDRTIFSTPFKRLQDKAQVFPLEEHDAVRTRLTHTMEVSCVARGLATAFTKSDVAKKLTKQQKQDIECVAATCALVHDLGNPPFGHAGERAIVEWFRLQQEKADQKVGFFGEFGHQGDALKGAGTQYACDFLHFDGNAQTQRLLSRLQVLSDDFGLNLTAATISASCKYTTKSHLSDPDASVARDKKHGYFASENDLMQKIQTAVGTGEFRHPIAILVEAADDIVNAAADLEDGVRKRCFDSTLLTGELQPVLTKKLASSLEKASAKASKAGIEGWALSEAWAASFRTKAIGEMVVDASNAFEEKYSGIMDGTFEESLIDASASNHLNARCKTIAKRYLYTQPFVMKQELRGRRIIHDLMDFYWQAISGFTDETHLKHFDRKTFDIISPNYRHVFSQRQTAAKSKKGSVEKLPIRYLKMQLLTDQISGMTDSYAVALHRQLFNA
jgi:dGTPase